MFNVISRRQGGGSGSNLTTMQVQDLTHEKDSDWQRIWTGEGEVYITNDWVIVEIVQRRSTPGAKTL